MCGTVLLEPLDAIAVDVPDEHLGTVLGDLAARRGRVLGTDAAGADGGGLGAGRTIVRAEVPRTELLRYAVDLRAMTSGAAGFTRTFARYEPAPTDLDADTLPGVACAGVTGDAAVDRGVRRRVRHQRAHAAAARLPRRARPLLRRADRRVRACTRRGWSRRCCSPGRRRTGSAAARSSCRSWCCRCSRRCCSSAPARRRSCCSCAGSCRARCPGWCSASAPRGSSSWSVTPPARPGSPPPRWAAAGRSDRACPGCWRSGCRGRRCCPT